jgi:hypothetical protein
MSIPESTHDVAEATERKGSAAPEAAESERSVEPGSETTKVSAEGKPKQVQPDGR